MVRKGEGLNEGDRREGEDKDKLGQHIKRRDRREGVGLGAKNKAGWAPGLVS